MSIDFIVTSLVVILLPGTGVLYTLAIGLGRGFQASIAAAFGCTLGIIPHVTASIVGLAALLHASALAFQIIRYAGAVYLIYMAWSVLRADGTLNVTERRRRTSLARVTTDGIVLNILNPKLSLFFLAFLPQFVSLEPADATLELISLALLFMLMTFVVFVGYGACAASARHLVVSRPAILQAFRWAFAGTFAFLGLRLAFTDR